MNKKVKLFLIGALTRFLYLFISMVTARLVTELFMRLLIAPILSSAFDSHTQPIHMIARAILMLILALLVCGVFAYFEGYRLSDFPTKDVAFESLAAVPVFFGISILLGFGEWVCGPVKSITGILYYGRDMNVDVVVRTRDVPLWIFVLSWVAAIGLCVGVMLLAYNYGGLKRLALREELKCEAEVKKRRNKGLINGSDNKNKGSKAE